MRYVAHIDPLAFEIGIVDGTNGAHESHVAADLHLAPELKMNAPDAAPPALPRRVRLANQAAKQLHYCGAVASNDDEWRTKPEQDALLALELDLIKTLGADLDQHAPLVEAIHQLLMDASPITPDLAKLTHQLIHHGATIHDLLAGPTTPNQTATVERILSGIAQTIQQLGQHTPLPQALPQALQRTFDRAALQFARPDWSGLLPQIVARLPMPLLPARDVSSPRTAPALVQMAQRQHQTAHQILSLTMMGSGGSLSRPVLAANQQLAGIPEQKPLPSPVIQQLSDIARTSPPQIAGTIAPLVQTLVTESQQIRAQDRQVPVVVVEHMDRAAAAITPVLAVLKETAPHHPNTTSLTRAQEKIFQADQAPITPAARAEIAALPQQLGTQSAPLPPTATAALATLTPTLADTIPQLIAALPPGPTITRAPDPVAPAPQRIPPPSIAVAPSVVPFRAPSTPQNDAPTQKVERSAPPQPPEAKSSVLERLKSTFTRVCPKNGTADCHCDDPKITAAERAAIAKDNAGWTAIRDKILTSVKTPDYDAVRRANESTMGKRFKTACGPNCQDPSHAHGTSSIDQAKAAGTSTATLQAATADDYANAFDDEPPAKRKKGQTIAPG